MGNDENAYVYLHHEAQADGLENLILRYDGDDPEITWVGRNQLNIRARNVSEVVTRKARLAGVVITYELHGPVFTPGQSK